MVRIDPQKFLMMLRLDILVDNVGRTLKKAVLNSNVFFQRDYKITTMIVTVHSSQSLRNLLSVFPHCTSHFE